MFVLLLPLSSLIIDNAYMTKKTYTIGVIHFQFPFAVRLEVPYLIGSRLVIAATHQLAAYFGGFPDFQPFIKVD